MKRYLTTRTIAVIRQRRRAGESLRSLAKDYAVGVKRVKVLVGIGIPPVPQRILEFCKKRVGDITQQELDEYNRLLKRWIAESRRRLRKTQ